MRTSPAGLFVACFWSLGLVALFSTGVLAQQANAAPPYSSWPVLSDEGSGDVVRRLGSLEQRLQQLKASHLPPVDEIRPTAVSGRYASLLQENTELADRVRALEEKWKKQEAADAKKKLDAAGKPSLKIFGRIHADYWAFPGNSPGANLYENGDPGLDVRDRFLFRRARIGVSGDILETMRYKLEMEFAVPETPTFKDAYLGWDELPFLQTVLLGNQKRPYGLDHLNSSRFNVFLERPFVIEGFNQDSRRFGMVSYGVSDDLAYNWRYGTYLATDISRSGSYLVTDDPGSHHYQAEFAGRFANTIWYDESSDGRGYAHWAVSGSVVLPDGTAGDDNVANFDTRPEARTSSRWLATGPIVGADTYELLGLEAVVNVGPIQVVGEYQRVWVQRDFGGPDVHFHGGYIYISYFLTGEHMPWDRESGTLDRIKPFENFFWVNRCDCGTGHGWGAWQVAARWSYGDLTDEDIGGGVGSSFTFGLNWYWTPYSRMQFNYIYGNIEQRFNESIPNASYNILGTRFMVDY